MRESSESGNEGRDHRQGPVGPSDAANRPPIRIGRYPIVGELGRGGMGVVYLAEDPAFPRQIAIKILPPELDDRPGAAERLRKEAALLATISHPNIATVYSIEKDDTRHFITMEVVTGCTLAERLAAGSLPLKQALQICRQIMAALETAHRKGIIHRDLKPSNIIITEDGHVKVLDFGIAKDTGGRGAVEPSGHDSTVSIVALGTPGYASPEQLKGEACDARTDLWAFGCILFECLAGESAFPGKTQSDRIAASLKSEPRWELLPADVPEAIRGVVARCLVKDPDGRFQSAAELRRHLGEALREVHGRRSRVPRRGFLIAAAVALLLLVLWQVGRHLAFANVTCDVHDRTISARTPLLGEIWSVRHDAPIHFLQPGPWEGTETIVYGLRAGGRQGGTLFVREQGTGRLLWKAEPDLVEIAEVFGHQYAAAGSYHCREAHEGDLDGDGVAELVIYRGHDRWYPAHVAIHGRDGERRGAYYNFGLAHNIVADDIDDDGKDEILISGTNNAHQAATVILLDEDHCWGAAVDERVHPDCILGDSSLARVILPSYDDEYMKLLGIERPVAYDVQIGYGAGGVVSITCSVGSETAPHVVEFDEYLVPVRISVSGTLRLATRSWPEELAEAFLGKGCQQSWLARHEMYGVAHRQSGSR